MSEKMPLPFNPRSPEFRANPYPTYDYLRTHHPIYYRPEPKDWVLTRYADIVEALTSPSFGRAESGLAGLTTANQEAIHPFLSLRQDSQRLMALWLVLRNPPDHTRIRQWLVAPFSPARIKIWRSRIQEKVDDLIERVKEQRTMDIIHDFAYPLTLDVNCEILGIPKSEWHPRFKQWSEGLSAVGDLDTNVIANEKGLLAIAGLAQYFRSLIAKHYSDRQPQENLISTLVQAQAEGQLSEEELIANCILLFFAGDSTTKHLIGNSILTLLDHPQQLRQLQANPSLIETTISEVLRYEGPFQVVSRTALSDIQLSNTTIHRGEIVNCMLAAGNRDPAKFPNPEKFDIQRQPNPYLSFGRGIHICLGRHLGKLLAEIAVGTLVNRLPELSIATESLEWEDTFLARGLKSLPVVF
ncbi:MULTISPECIES: cytochrome P450 [unclassified Roseofilum]|uniref:cytochrome P450 n=1 Tax=unclassified Roseofilum TaxID=2620099 RepID=UPI000E989D80|nr:MULTISPECIES: cytochrome P450 [unclassified Roseofilum]MBP0007973.1 cytochrome P450 [Roseofilum sp. Belize Diploria]MBP0032381.1 cytochrome P450 [Roseofilum sp. Belize BBD 4]HBQ97761.1 cytochrome P450 [Cyanobacteria bacterium UBA11691]